MKNYILWFNEIGIDDIGLVGGKNASLGEMRKDPLLKNAVPDGFAITAHGYTELLEHGGIVDKLKKTVKLKNGGAKARKLIEACPFPKDLEEAILSAYEKLTKKYGPSVAVRSSATLEDLPTASFAGQQESFLNVKGKKELLDACKKCFSSLFTDRAIAYRETHKFDHFKVRLSIGVQHMVQAERGAAGVIFTLDTETGFKEVVFLTGTKGLGERVVQGAVNPDEYYVFKPTMALINKRLGAAKEFCLTDKEVKQLAKLAMQIEAHYSKKHGKWTPMDIEWAKDGITGKLYLVQARPETVFSQKKRTILEEFRLKKKGPILATGKSVGNKISHGKAHVIKDVKEISRFKAGQVLVTEMTDPDWVPIMRIAAGIVTNRGGRTSHAAIVSRELGLPCVVGTNDATSSIKNGQNITVNCSQGETGYVHEGLLDYTIDKIDIAHIPQTKTRVMMNVSSPEEAFELQFLPNAGVGLARQEFIISEYIQTHPMALIHFDKVKDKATRDKITKLTQGYKTKEDYFIEKLAMGIGQIAASFYPKDVILRFSDFKTNEYANLLGGTYFEPKEENPMIGWRGASRYYSAGYKEGFRLECKAIKKVREHFGLTNLKVMIPMCRTVEEGKKVLAEMKKNGLERGKNGLEVYVMCEIPSNVLVADQFCDIFDGFSIGSNDLTQMTLGVDRDSALVADLFDERNEAVLRMIKQVITTAKKRKKKIGICGDAPSTYPEFTKFLVDCGIDSISLSPDALLRTLLVIALAENE